MNKNIYGKCPCGKNGKTYQQCCLAKVEEEQKKYKVGQENSSENVQLCLDYLKEEYDDHEVIDITNNLSNTTYKSYQIANYESNIIMVAERTDKNKAVFESRGGLDNDIIIMYRGSYRVFQSDDLYQVTESLEHMIKTRLSGQVDK